MREIQETNPCGRADELLGYLYGESAGDERADFEQHLDGCAACRDELAAYGAVRAAVGDWRAELLHAAPTLSISDATARPALHATTEAGAVAATAARTSAPPSDISATTGATPTRRPLLPDALPRRSARAAFREFFALSPAWLRAASAAAALLFCALAALAAFGFGTRTGGRGLAASGQTDPAREETRTPADGGERAALLSRLGALEAERDAARRELEETRAQLDDSRASNIEDAVFAEAASAAPPPAQESARPRRTPARRGASKRRGPRNSRDEDDLPRLLDLLGGAN